jgi:hypothetical protein
MQACAILQSARLHVVRSGRFNPPTVQSGAFLGLGQGFEIECVFA